MAAFVLYTNKLVTGEGIVTTSVVDVNATRGIKSPLLG